VINLPGEELYKLVWSKTMTILSTEFDTTIHSVWLPTTLRRAWTMKSLWSKMTVIQKGAFEIPTVRGANRLKPTSSDIGVGF